MRVAILGGGLAGISLALFLQNHEEISQIHILEKEPELGGLCRSFEFDGRMLDIGPHIFFSKDKEALEIMLELLGDNKEQHKRLNKIPYGKVWVRYPFENDLAALPEQEKSYCVETFLHNPYREYDANNMLQFFLKTFGEGITNLYLRPYNEKIWKFDPSFMDTKMVERIPRPPDEDVLRSARGDHVEGYLHQLYFFYPKQGGMAAFVEAIRSNFNNKVRVHLKQMVVNIQKGEHWRIQTKTDAYDAEAVISTIPVTNLVEMYERASLRIKKIGKALKYNNIIIASAKISTDRLGNSQTLTIADKDIIFHRLSKVDYMGGVYQDDGVTATYMMEYTYPDGDRIAGLPMVELKKRFLQGLKKLGLLYDSTEVLAFDLKKYPYAYVVYDLNHSSNMKEIREFFSEEQLILHGRFGNFEYWNMDKVVAESKALAENFQK